MAASQNDPPEVLTEEFTARDPFAYRVISQPTIDDQGDRYRGHYLGEVGGSP
jgi:hypothetical protein